jgi:hypothetical protein
VVNVYAVHHKDDCAEECIPILARTRQQALSRGAKELDDSYSAMRARVQALINKNSEPGMAILAEYMPRILTDDEARLFGWRFEGDEEA